MISVVIPAMNEEATIGEVVGDVHRALRGGPYPYEVIVVDDHSTDLTTTVARRAGAEIVSNTGPRGKGQTLRAGFEQARGEYLVMMDADRSHRAEDILKLIAPLEEGAGLVIGSRIYGGSDEYTRVRALGNIFLTAAFGLLHKRYLSDALNGFKAFRRDVVRRYPLTAVSFDIEIELLAAALRGGHRIVEVPSHERSRQGGQAKSRVIRHGAAFLKRIIYEWWRSKTDRS
jgi:glycosyltransferase involved in cell wall biosynthesis